MDIDVVESIATVTLLMTPSGAKVKVKEQQLLNAKLQFQVQTYTIPAVSIWK